MKEQLKTDSLRVGETDIFSIDYLRKLIDLSVS